MLEGLEAMQQQQPKQQKLKAEAEKARERAFNRSYREAAKREGMAEGAAAGVAAWNGATPEMVEGARQRALGGGSTPAARGGGPAVASPPAVRPEQQQFVQVTARGKQYRVPDPQWYSLSQEQRDRYLDAVDGDGESKRDESVALQSINSLLDLIDANKAKAAKREAALLQVIAGLTARVDALEQSERTHEIKASKELAEQQARLSEAVIAASGVEASLRNQTATSQVEHDRQRDEHRARLEATERVVGDQEGRLKASGQLYQERGNALEDKAATVEQRLAKAEVQQVEISDGITANRQTLRAVTGTDFASEIDLAVKASFDARLAPAVEGLIERKYTVTAPTTGTGGINAKLDNGTAKAFLTRQLSDDTTAARAVEQALRRGGKR